MPIQSTRILKALSLAVLLAVATTNARAEAHYAHEHILHALPEGHQVFDHHGDHYYFAHGFWYHGHGPEFIAVAPPIGLRVGLLPFGYRMVIVAGVTYFVLNDIWYQQIGSDYVVVNAPPDAPVVAGAPVIPSSDGSDVFIYPRNGQSEGQQAQDRYECHHWAVQQTGFDPTQPLGGVPADESTRKRTDYHRANSACLEGRGYTVK